LTGIDLKVPLRIDACQSEDAQGEVRSCHLQEPLGKSQPTISHHTRVLAQAGLIEADKWWRIAHERLAAVRQALGGT